MRTSSTCLPSDFEPKGYETKTSTRVYRTITCSLRRALTLDDFRNSFAPDVGVIHTQPSVCDYAHSGCFFVFGTRRCNRSKRRLPLHAESEATGKLVDQLVDNVPLLRTLETSLNHWPHVLHVVLARVAPRMSRMDKLASVCCMPQQM